jgi:protein phosphatase
MTVNGAYDRIFSSLPVNGLWHGARAHIGRKKENQDEIRLPGPEEGLDGAGRLFAVADGMGGHRGGRVASRMACRGLEDYFHRFSATKRERRPSALRRGLEETVLRTARRLLLTGRKDPGLEEMGTTLSCLVFTARRTLVAHVGDSRVYRLRNGRLTPLTTDHTLVQDMVFEGDIPPEAAADHPLRHMLTRALGGAETLEQVDTRIDFRRDMDRFLLCTDGLHDVVPSSRIQDRLSLDAPPARIARRLVDDALENGGRDNIAVLTVLPFPPNG